MRIAVFVSEVGADRTPKGEVKRDEGDEMLDCLTKGQSTDEDSWGNLPNGL